MQETPMSDTEQPPSSEEILLSSFRAFLATLNRHGQPTPQPLTTTRLASILSCNPPRDMTSEERILLRNLEEQTETLIKNELESFPDSTQAHDIAVALEEITRFKILISKLVIEQLEYSLNDPNIIKKIASHLSITPTTNVDDSDF